MKNTLRFLFKFFGIAILCVGGIFLIINLSTKKYIYNTTESIPHAQAALILGAGISSQGKLSGILKERADTAIKLYKEKVVENILVTGDNGTLYHNEVNPVRLYLLQEGIPDKDIFLDHAGFDTYSSMYRARDIFLTKKVIIVSQSFHLPRAVFIARNLKIDAYGMNADQGHYLARNYIREFPADIKAIMDLLLKRSPKYLGEEIPITGDARNSE